MKILFLNPNVPSDIGYEDGEDFVTLADSHQRYCKITRDLGHEVEFGYLTDSYEEYPHHKYGHTVYGFPVRMKLPYMEISTSLLRYLLTANLDLVYINAVYSHRILPIVLAVKKSGTPIILHHHGDVHREPRFKIQQQLLRVLLNRMESQVISVNNKVVDDLREAGFENARQLAYGIDTELFEPKDRTECRQEVGFSDDKTHILYVGRIKEIKGVDYLVRALNELSTRYPDLRLHLIYGGHQEETLDRIQSFVSENNLTTVIDFIGRVDRERLPLYYNAADCGVYPSIRDGYPMVPLEAMSCGQPIIGTDTHVDAGQRLEDGVNALVAESSSVPSLVEKIQLYLDEPNTASEIGENARKTIEEHYTWDAVQSTVSDIITQLVVKQDRANRNSQACQ